jgi:hypothetical protein
LWVLGLAPAVAVALLLLFQSAEAKVFWQLAEGAVESLLVAVAAEPCAVQVRPRPAVGAMDSVTPAVWE